MFYSNYTTGYSVFSPVNGSTIKFSDNFLFHLGKDKSAHHISRDGGPVNHDIVMRQVGRMVSC